MATWPECVVHEKSELHPKGGENVADLKWAKYKYNKVVWDSS